MLPDSGVHREDFGLLGQVINLKERHYLDSDTGSYFSQ
jgi:hypothetical protein